ncbi:MAG: flagellar hook-associated protein 3 [Spirochaetaceae bacterium]|nr:flagellar hook-associated protein 3 [Spirochaetaceae bacterium]MBQ3024100.1 flagellar hook-associated protein 3 [Spirochaetaceae bacterium]MBQ7905285.1 flagellar hook-associated protein 3 [Spirochaetaceae bacterium]
MRRVSSATANNDIQYNLRLQESRVNNLNNQLGSQNRLQQLRDDPLAAGHLVRYQSYATRVEQFEKNAKIISDDFTVAEGYVNQSVQIMQRVRELAVNGANGYYEKEDLRNMAVEVDELLKELIQNSNAIGPDGTRIFAGTRTSNIPFEAETGYVKGSSEPLITSVKYQGSIGTKEIEVDEQARISIDKSGNSIFWAEKQQLISSADATSYSVQQESKIAINGQEIKLEPGDNVYSIISKINDSGTSVKASLDPITKGLNLETTDSRQLWLEDISGTTLTDLAIIKDSSQRPPYNISDSVTVSGGSLFDSVIALRDSMLSGDIESIGGRVLGSIDNGIDNLLTRQAEIGSNYERAQQSIAKAQTNQLGVTNMIAREGDLDFTKAITDMKMLEYVKQATLSTAGRLYESSLLNYMR